MPLGTVTALPVEELVDPPNTDTRPATVASTPDCIGTSPLLAAPKDPEDNVTMPDTSSTDSPLPIIAEPLKATPLAEAPLHNEPAPDEMDTSPPKPTSLVPPLRETTPPVAAPIEATPPDKATSPASPEDALKEPPPIRTGPPPTLLVPATLSTMPPLALRRTPLVKLTTPSTRTQGLHLLPCQISFP
ncbi:hypothetical protein JG688_00011103 [Phytophthora aleatoria]|uniref:Uncharacterized protein n=1 Tax=Phytophthora aleatoria TaxID=2496075 RepID=A0A8J5J0Y3_9STRA|nr:hypothetical protein JG688_00011103 [Phytophthora aleatoria]